MENTEKKAGIESESRLTLFEVTSIIVGHGVGSGILAVPYIAASVVFIGMKAVGICATSCMSR